ncbi:MAG: lipase family protein [Paludibacteraceae bacterium]|nr:lipase family protein [Paludibacteraceae bacterium]
MKKILLSILLIVSGLCNAAIIGIAGNKEQVLHYPSTDQNGKTITLSGKLSVPDGKKPKGIILMPHYTISSNAEAPSSELTIDARYFIDDYVVILPDYIGYGASLDRVHPYLRGDLTARNCVDMLLYTQTVLDTMSLGIALDSIYIAGYSQGGATALWILKLLEEEYADRIHVKKCYVGSGPCDVAATYDYSVKYDFNSVPAVIPMLVVGTSEAYGLNLDFDHFFTPALKSKYDKYIANKDYRLFSVYCMMPSHKASYWMTIKGMDKTQSETRRLYDGLLRSSLVHYDLDGGTTDSVCPTWRPKAPLYVFHSINDDLVPFVNAENLRRCFGEAPNITWDFDKYGGHAAAMVRYMPKVQKMIEED